MEKTFVMVKPDGVQRQLIGEILLRFERKGGLIEGYNSDGGKTFGIDSVRSLRSWAIDSRNNLARKDSISFAEHHGIVNL